MRHSRISERGTFSLSITEVPSIEAETAVVFQIHQVIEDLRGKVGLSEKARHISLHFTRVDPKLCKIGKRRIRQAE